MIKQLIWYHRKKLTTPLLIVDAICISHGRHSAVRMAGSRQVYSSNPSCAPEHCIAKEGTQ